MRNVPGASAALTATFLCVACSGDLGERGVDPSQPLEAWTLVEELRIGEGEGPEVFEWVSAFAVSPGGDLFVIDGRGARAEIRMFDATGAFVRTIGRQGEGPGEITLPEALRTTPDGRLWVIDRIFNRLLLFGADGTPETHTSMRFERSRPGPWDGAVDAQGRLLDPVHVTLAPDPEEEEGDESAPERVRRFRRIGAEGAVLDTIGLGICGAPYSGGYRPSGTGAAGTGAGGSRVTISGPRLDPFRPGPQAAVGTDGTVWCSPRDEYLLARTTLGDDGALDGGDTLTVVRLPIPGEPFPDSVRERYEGSFELPPVQPVIGEIGTDDAGRVWVRRFDGPSRRESAAADSAVFDVFDTDGRYVARARADFGILGVPVVIGDRAYAVTLDEMDVEYLVRARIAAR